MKLPDTNIEQALPSSWRWLGEECAVQLGACGRGAGARRGWLCAAGTALAGATVLAPAALARWRAPRARDSTVSCSHQSTTTNVAFLLPSLRIPSCRLQGCKDFKDNKAAISGSCSSGDPSGCNDWGKAYYGVDKYKGLSMNQSSADNLGQGALRTLCGALHAVHAASGGGLLVSSPLLSRRRRG